jgi:Flp pilus assembly protein TadG
MKRPAQQTARLASGAGPRLTPVSPTAARRRGATIVEFALISQVIFFLVLGIIELGRALMVAHLLSDVARQSARYAVVTEGGNKSTTTIQTYASNLLTSYGLTTTNTPLVYVNDSSGTDLSTSTGPSQQTGSSNFGKYSNGSEVTVKVQVNFAEFTWLPFAKYLTGNTTLSGQYTLRRDPL